MDPTAPKDNDQQAQANENQKQTPVQTGGFVVSGEQGSPSDPNQSPAPSQLDPQSSQPISPSTQPAAPQPASSDLQSDLQSTVAAATGTNLAGSSEPTASLPDSSIGPVGSTPPGQQQPDPTPFTAPPPMEGAPTPGPNPNGVPQSQGTSSPEGESKSGKMKSLIIVVAVFILVVILAAIAWYFILNRGQSEEAGETTDTRPIELPSSPSPRSEGGFGDLPSPSPEATDAADITGEELPEETPPEFTTQ